MLLTPGTVIAYRDPTGFTWRLAGYGAGLEGVLLKPGPGGLLGAPTDLIFSEGARQQGATFTGLSVGKRELDFEVDVHADNPHEFRLINERWLRAHQYRTPGHLISWSPCGPWLSMRMRKAAVPVPKWDKDPSLICSQTYAMRSVAEAPYWNGMDETAFWSDKGGASNGVLKIRNPGHIEAWPRFIVTGPGTPSIQDGQSGQMMPLPKIDAGEFWRIDTFNRKPTIVSNKRTNPWAYMKGRRFRNPIQPGATAEINVTFKGGDRTNSILMVLTPRYEWVR